MDIRSVMSPTTVPDPVSDCTSIHALASLCGIRPERHLDEPETIRLPDGNLLHVERGHRADRVHLYLLLGPAPAVDATSASLYRRLLGANAFNEGTDGATIGMDEASDEFVLSREFALADLDFDTLRDAAQSMSVIASRWRARIAPPSQAASLPHALPGS